MAGQEQRPLVLILARNLLSNISTPAVLVNLAGDALFYNEAAGALFGRRFEDTGVMPAAEWTSPLTKALRANRAAHGRHQIRSADGTLHPIEASGVPVMGSDRFQGAMIFFWAVPEDGS
jgi:PAS domain-containing protein